MDRIQQGLADFDIDSPTAPSTIGYVPPYSAPCANIQHIIAGKAANCANDSTHSCGQCHLVRYCSKECQVSHWPMHKLDCKSPLGKVNWQPAWVSEGRVPAFATGGPPVVGFGQRTFLWGNVPAFDALNIRQNEGATYGNDLDLCFAASGDPRNILSTINGLPTTYEGTCTSVVNDKNFIVAARNFIMLLLCAQLPPVEAAELVLHLWYSARLTLGMRATLEKHAKELIAHVVCKIKSRTDNVLLSKRWTFGSTVINVCLYKPQWTTLLQILEVKHDVLSTEQQRRAIVLAPSRIDYRDRQLYVLSSSRRMCETRFRETGVLAPFGACLDQFDCCNPLLFNHETSAWLQKDSANPFEGWRMQSIFRLQSLQRTSKWDLHGLLSFHVRGVIEEFCCRLQDSSLKTRFIFYSVNATMLPSLLDDPLKLSGFDRIEVTNIADDQYLGLHMTLTTFAPLIKRRNINPYATLLTLFLNACETAEIEMGRRHDARLQLARTKQVAEYTNTNKDDMLRFLMMPMSAEKFKFDASKDMVRDFDEIFKWYMKDASFQECAELAGLKAKESNTIIEEWPMRLKKKAGEPGAEEEFNMLRESASSGAERYMEWVRQK